MSETPQRLEESIPGLPPGIKSLLREIGDADDEAQKVASRLLDPTIPKWRGERSLLATRSGYHYDKDSRNPHAMKSHAAQELMQSSGKIETGVRHQGEGRMRGGYTHVRAIPYTTYPENYTFDRTQSIKRPEPETPEEVIRLITQWTIKNGWWDDWRNKKPLESITETIQIRPTTFDLTRATDLRSGSHLERSIKGQPHLRPIYLPAPLDGSPEEIYSPSIEIPDRTTLEDVLNAFHKRIMEAQAKNSVKWNPPY
ncbi:MAG: hypothetical protein AAB373_01085 [Patescibacteria group bacterium]